MVYALCSLISLLFFNPLLYFQSYDDITSEQGCRKKLYISDYIFLRQYWQENIKLLCVQIHTCRNNNHIYKRNYTKIGSLGHWLLLFTDITLTCKERVTRKLSKSSIAKKIILLNLVLDSVGSKFGHSLYPSYPFGWQHL